MVEDGVVLEAHEADRLIPWWSFTKLVLAAAALVLVRDGLLSLDESLPDKPYTLCHLLQHRSGLADYGGSQAYRGAVARGDEPWPASELLKAVDADRLRYPTGEGWEYSNIGYFFVRQLIETTTGRNLNAALHQLVLKPLGIERTHVARTTADLENVWMGNAQSYHPGWVYHGLLVGPGRDAALLLDHLMAGRLLSENLMLQMREPFILPGPIPGRPWQVPGYGLGVMMGETTNGRRVAGHTGGGPGSTIAVYRTVESGGPERTAVAFALSEDAGRTEEKAFELLRKSGT